MKKIFALFVLLLLMLSVTTVIAQEENEAEEQEEELSEEEENSEIEREAKILQTNLGAKIRLLLLEKAVMNAIARGEIVISYFEEKGKEVNSLKDIIDKLYSLNAEIQEMKNEDSLSVEKYVQLRKDAGNLIREFRKLVWDNTTPEERREIHSLLQDANYSFLDEIREEIRLLIREHNAQKTKEIRERIGAEGLDYSDDVKSGRMSAEEARRTLQEEYKQLSEERRAEAQQRLEEAKMRAERIRAEARLRLQENNDEAMKARLEYRERMNLQAEELRRQMEERIKNEAGELRIRQTLR